MLVYKWYCCVLCKTQLIFLRINGPYAYIYIVSHQVMTHSFNIKASFWKIYFILKLLYTSSRSKLIYSHLPLGDFSWLIFHKHLHKISYIFSLFQPLKYPSFSPKKGWRYFEWSPALVKGVGIFFSFNYAFFSKYWLPINMLKAV